MKMKREYKFSMKQIVFTLTCVIALSYFTYQARFLIFGSGLKITYPANGASVATPLLMVEGQAKNIAWISLNDRQIFTDEKGFWKEKLMVSPGPSIITVKTRDRFGREEKKTIQVVAN
jgi:hypothetical protein